MAVKTGFVAVIAMLNSFTTAQIPLGIAHDTGFNSSFTLTPSQIEKAQLDSALAKSIEINTNFDRTQLAFGGPREDDFYTLPPLTNQTGPLEPGQILKVQPFTNSTAYAIPPSTALSRIMYTTTNFNGTVVPTTGFVLWPYVALDFQKGSVEENNPVGPIKASVVVWTHGTSGFFTDQAPSAHRSLWYGNAGPFTLAKSGYAVFAPDYAGLGITEAWDGSELVHQYSFSPASAHDALYGVRAALEAFPDFLEENFVVMGHSQGGGVAWSVAEVMSSETDEFTDLSPMYKGAIAASPTTRALGAQAAFILPSVALGLHSVFPDFHLGEWLTNLGVARSEVARDIQASNSVLQQLHSSGERTYREDWNKTWYADAFSRLGDAGRRDAKGPILVVQGTNDTYVPYEVTAETVKETTEMYPSIDLEFLVASGVAHTPVLHATQHYWLRWIEERLGGNPLEREGSVRTDLESLLPADQYLASGTSFPLWAGLPEYSYELPLAA